MAHDDLNQMTAKGLDRELKRIHQVKMQLNLKLDQINMRQSKARQLKRLKELRKPFPEKDGLTDRSKFSIIKR